MDDWCWFGDDSFEPLQATQFLPLLKQLLGMPEAIGEKNGECRHATPHREQIRLYLLGSQDLWLEK